MRTLVLMLLLVFSSTAIAQPTPPAPDRREKIKQRIRALRAYTLTEQLQLDEATAAKLFPALQKYDDEFDKLLIARADIQRRLDASESITDPKQLDKLIDEAVANQRALWETEEKRLTQLRKILTPAQTARVLVVLPAMERKIQNQLRKAVQRPARGGAGGDLTKNPFEKDEDVIELDTPPVERRGGTRRDRAERVTPRDQVCDPFTNVHGCKPAPRAEPRVTPRAEPRVTPRADRKCDPFSDMTGCK